MDIQWTPALRRTAFDKLLDARWRQNVQMSITAEEIVDRLLLAVGDQLDDLLTKVVVKQLKLAPDRRAALTKALDELDALEAVVTPADSTE